MTAAATASSSPSAILLQRLEEVHGAWVELCRWDPEVPPDAAVAGAQVLVAVADALERPQPLGWGTDPALVGPAGELAGLATAPEIAACQLVCLREALLQHFVEHLPSPLRAETGHRVNMIVDRLITQAVRESTHHLRTLAFIDALTGLPNRRAFDDDLGRETSRARRHDHVLSVAVLDVDGLKDTNDRWGHDAGDELLRTVAMLLRSALRNEDVAYRIGGDEFAVLLPDVDAADPGFLVDRLQAAGAPAVSVGVASSVRDPVHSLVALADQRLYAARRTARDGDREGA